ncbi:MAG TPA: type II toxin-antitoxin system RelE/ParE family toxin [Terracidiphilus sp.]|nr:type II toxin-antitoxin system RelE/ParE family toxin [Terracidiphilus sp.]
MLYPVVFSPEAGEQLVELYRYIAEHASAEIAASYTEAIVAHCERMQRFPQRGILRDDIRPGLRITHFRRRTVIAFVVEETRVVILGVFHGGRNYEGVLLLEKDEKQDPV